MLDTCHNELFLDNKYIKLFLTFCLFRENIQKCLNWGELTDWKEQRKMSGKIKYCNMCFFQWPCKVIQWEMPVIKFSSLQVISKHKYFKGLSGWMVIHHLQWLLVWQLIAWDVSFPVKGQLYSLGTLASPNGKNLLNNLAKVAESWIKHQPKTTNIRRHRNSLLEKISILFYSLLKEMSE